MSKKIIVFEMIVLALFMLGCSRNVKDTEIMFSNNKLQLDDSNKVKVKGRLVNGETGELEANVNREKKIIDVDNEGNFSFYYQIKNLQDNKLYLGIKSNGTIIGNEIDISISKSRRNDSLIRVDDILDCYRTNGLNVANTEELQKNDYLELGLKTFPYSGVKFSTVFNDEQTKYVRILLFSKAKDLDEAYNVLKIQAIKDDGNTDLEEFNDVLNPTTHINPIVYSKFIFYRENIQGFPLLRSWVYKTYIEDVGYVLIQQDAGINSIIAGKHEELAKNILNNNIIDNT